MSSELIFPLGVLKFCRHCKGNGTVFDSELMSEVICDVCDGYGYAESNDNLQEQQDQRLGWCGE